MLSFNLISEPCIPVRVNGELRLYSLEQTLLHAEQIERLEDASPLVMVSLHKLLLAVLYRALKGPEDFAELETWFIEGFPQDDIRAYLDKYTSRFDLFDRGRPFFQVHDLDKAVFGNPIEPKAWTELSPESRDGGQGAALFNHENVVPEPIPADEAFRQLLVRQTFSLGGLSRTFDYSAKRSPSPNAVHVIARGKNLHETLCYNLDPDNFALYDLDVPFWEEVEGLSISRMEKVKELDVRGCAQAYTWPSRSVKLIPLETEAGLFVREVYLASGIAPKFEVARYFDPMLGRTVAKTGKYQGEHVFRRFRSERKFWRDFHSLFAHQGDTVPPRVLNISVHLASRFDREVSLGIYGLNNATQEAKIDFARQEHYVLPEAVVADRTTDVYVTLEQTLAQAEALHSGLRSATKQLVETMLSHGGRSPDPKDVNGMLNTLPASSAYWSDLERAFPDLLKSLDADFKPQPVQVAWARQLLEASKRAWSIARQFAGTDAHALRAIYSAEKPLRNAEKNLRVQSGLQERA